MPNVAVVIEVQGVLHFHMPDGTTIDCPFMGRVDDKEASNGDYSRQQLQDGGA